MFHFSRFLMSQSAREVSYAEMELGTESRERVRQDAGWMDQKMDQKGLL